MIFRSFVFIATCVLLFSCGKSIDRKHEDYVRTVLVETPAFSIDFGTVEEPDHAVNASLIANPETQELIVLLSIVNNASDTVVLKANDFQLSTEEGNAVQPIDLESTTTIAPEKIVHLALKFSIINSRLFYATTGLAGDLNQRYQLNVNMPTHPVTLGWQLPEEVFNNYNRKYGIEAQTVVYIPEVDENMQKSYQIANGMDAFIHTGGMEIAAAGINLRFQSYYLKDTVHLAIRLVNHSNHEMRIYPEAFLLRHNHELLTPGQTSDPVHVKRSERYINIFTYAVNRAPTQFFLLKEAIKILTADTEEHLFAADLSFEVGQEFTP